MTLDNRGVNATLDQPGRWPGDTSPSVDVGASEPESLVLKFRSHGRRLFWSALVLVAVAGAGAYFIGAFEEAWQNLLALAGAVFAVLLCVIVPFFRWLTRSTVLTNKRVILRSGFFTRHRSEVPLTRIRETTLKQGLLQRAWGAGDLTLFTGVDDRVILKNIPKAQLCNSVLQELIERQYASERRPRFQ